MDKFKIIGQNDKSEDWNKEQIDVDPTRVQQDVKDDPRIIREFIFAFNPATVKLINEHKMETISRQGLFNSHAKQIEIMLWGDGLVFDTEFEPRLVIGKKKYKIVIVCKARKGVLLGRGDDPKSLSEALKS